jgi:hypothetical protein
MTSVTGLLLATLAFQGRQIPPAVASYVSVNAPVVALTHARLVDGTGAPAREDQTVVLRGARIAEVGPSSSTSAPPGAQVIDLSGQTIIPGLVQLHEHTYFGGVKQMTEMSTSGPLLYLAMGVTTAMTAGSQFPYPELNMKRMVDAGQLPGPRFHVTGPYLNGGPPRSGNARILQSPEEARRVIAYWVSEGATWFKFQGTVSREILGAAILEAHKLGARVTGHLCSVTFTEAASLGIDLLQHGFITNSDYVPDKKPDVCPPENMRVQADVDVSSPEVQRTIRQIVADQAAVASTLAVYETFVAERAKLDPRAMEFLDPDVRREVEQNHANIAKGGLTVPPRLIKKMMQWERDFVQAGGLLGSGSDPWGTGFLPGWGNLRNYELLIEAGFSPEQSVQIMTSNGAKILGEDGARGTIATGKVADLVIIRGNPIGTPSDIYEVVTVFKDGIGYDSMKLREGAKGKVGAS